MSLFLIRYPSSSSSIIIAPLGFALMARGANRKGTEWKTHGRLHTGPSQQVPFRPNSGIYCMFLLSCSPRLAWVPEDKNSLIVFMVMPALKRYSSQGLLFKYYSKTQYCVLNHACFNISRVPSRSSGRHLNSFSSRSARSVASASEMSSKRG